MRLQRVAHVMGFLAWGGALLIGALLCAKVFNTKQLIALVGLSVLWQLLRLQRLLEVFGTIATILADSKPK